MRKRRKRPFGDVEELPSIDRQPPKTLDGWQEFLKEERQHRRIAIIPTSET